MSYFDNGGIIGKTSTVKIPVPASTYDTAINNVSGGTPDFRWTLNNTTAEEGGHTTTVNGTWSYTNGLIPSNSDNSANLNGSTTYLVPANDPLINAGTGYSFTKRSISFWFNADTIGTYPCIWEQGGGVNWFSIYLNSGLIYVNIGEGSTSGGHATATVSTGVPYHCLITVDLTLGSNNLKIYLNGALEGQATSSVGADLAAHTADVRLGFGAARNHLNTSNPYTVFDGKLQDLCYWSEVALTATDAENIYNAGITTDTYNSGAWSLDAVYDSRI
jgi:hypothetical protein